MTTLLTAGLEEEEDEVGLEGWAGVVVEGVVEVEVVVWAGEEYSNFFFRSSASLANCVCVCVCVLCREREIERVCVCVVFCVCRERERERVYVYMHVYVHVHET